MGGFDLDWSGGQGKDIFQDVTLNWIFGKGAGGRAGESITDFFGDLFGGFSFHP